MIFTLRIQLQLKICWHGFLEAEVYIGHIAEIDKPDGFIFCNACADSSFNETGSEKIRVCGD